MEAIDVIFSTVADDAGMRTLVIFPCTERNEGRHFIAALSIQDAVVLAAAVATTHAFARSKMRDEVLAVAQDERDIALRAHQLAQARIEVLAADLRAVTRERDDLKNEACRWYYYSVDDDEGFATLGSAEEVIERRKAAAKERHALMREVESLKTDVLRAESKVDILAARIDELHKLIGCTPDTSPGGSAPIAMLDAISDRAARARRIIADGARIEELRAEEDRALKLAAALDKSEAERKKLVAELTRLRESPLWQSLHNAGGTLGEQARALDFVGETWVPAPPALIAEVARLRARVVEHEGCHAALEEWRLWAGKLGPIGTIEEMRRRIEARVNAWANIVAITQRPETR